MFDKRISDLEKFVGAGWREYGLNKKIDDVLLRLNKLEKYLKLEYVSASTVKPHYKKKK